MKTLIRNLLVGVFIGGSLIVGPHLLYAQEAAMPVQADVDSQNVKSLSDTEVLLQAVEMTPPVSADSVPRFATFYSAQHAPGTRLAWPPLPGNAYQLDAWNLGDDVFLLNDLNVDYSAPSGPMRMNGRMMMDGLTLPGVGGSFYSDSFTPPVYTTNDLWLQITGTTNTRTGLTAYLTIHKPWNDSNLSHDLYFTTSLDAPRQWDFMLRCPYTNAVVPDLCCPVGFFELGPATNGNLTVTTNATAQQLARLLVPPWVTVTNVTYTGANAARGTFAGGNGCGLPIESGVILASGDIMNAIGPNNFNNTTTKFNTDGDPDLNNLVGGGGTGDAAVLEFDIVSTNSFALQFQYIFASEEYPEWIGPYNDPMAIFVSTNRVGTTWINSITNDLALVPDTTDMPVSVNTINGGCVTDFYGEYIPSTNSQYYVDNHDPDFSALPPYGIAAPVFNIQYDGMTVLLTAQTSITANVTNHVKIAIADFKDLWYDSAVFIKAWSPGRCQ